MILEEIVIKTKERVENRKFEVSYRELEKQVKFCDNPFTFEKALQNDNLSFICEIKKASPSAGLIDEEFNYIEIAGEYEKSGADAVSVLTEPDYFLGKLDYLSDVKRKIKIPVLQKDFVIDEYQIYQARAFNADAILIICAILDSIEIAKFLRISESLGMSALVETHEINEIETALDCNAKIIGVNNRNLRTMKTDLNKTFELRKYFPENKIFVSESGIKTQTDIKMLSEAGVDAVLIGEALMGNKDKNNLLESMRGGLCR